MEPVGIIALIVAILGSGGLISWLQFRSTTNKTAAETNKVGYEAQAVVIRTLQEENKRLSAEVAALRLDVAELRGHLEAMERLKVDQIATATARKVVEELVGDPEVRLD